MKIIYSYYDLNNLRYVYIGQADDIDESRIRHFIRDSWCSPTLRLQYAFVLDEKADDIEKYLIEKLKPEHNKAVNNSYIPEPEMEKVINELKWIDYPDHNIFFDNEYLYKEGCGLRRK